MFWRRSGVCVKRANTTSPPMITTVEPTSVMSLAPMDTKNFLTSYEKLARMWPVGGECQASVNDFMHSSLVLDCKHLKHSILFCGWEWALHHALTRTFHNYCLSHAHADTYMYMRLMGPPHIASRSFAKQWQKLWEFTFQNNRKIPLECRFVVLNRQQWICEHFWIFIWEQRYIFLFLERIQSLTRHRFAIKCNLNGVCSRFMRRKTCDESLSAERSHGRGDTATVNQYLQISRTGAWSINCKPMVKRLINFNLL